MPGKEQVLHHGHQLRLAQHIPVGLGGNQRAEQVIARLRPTVGDQLSHIAIQPGDGRFQAAQQLGRVNRGEHQAEVGRPGRETVMVAVRHPQHGPHHPNGQLMGEPVNQVRRVVREPVQQLRGDLGHPRAKPLHCPRGERPADQSPQPSVDRRVGREHDLPPPLPQSAPR